MSGQQSLVPLDQLASQLGGMAREKCRGYGGSGVRTGRTLGLFKYPQAVAVSKGGVVAVVDRADGVLHFFTGSGIFLTSMEALGEERREDSISLAFLPDDSLVLSVSSSARNISIYEEYVETSRLDYFPPPLCVASNESTIGVLDQSLRVTLFHQTLRSAPILSVSFEDKFSVEAGLFNQFSVCLMGEAIHVLSKTDSFVSVYNTDEEAESRINLQVTDLSVRPSSISSDGVNLVVADSLNNRTFLIKPDGIVVLDDVSAVCTFPPSTVIMSRMILPNSSVVMAKLVLK